MSKNSRSPFTRQRLNTLFADKRIDAAIVITGLIIALIFGVLTWFNYQDRAAPANAHFSEDRHAMRQ